MKTKSTQRKFYQGVLSGSVARRLAVALFLFGMIGTFFATALQTYLDYQTALDSIDNQIERVGISHRQSLASSVWTFSERQIQIELEGLLNNSNFQYAEIKTTEGEHWFVGDKGASVRIAKEFPLFIIENDTEQILGNLRIVAGEQALLDRLLKKGLNTLLYFGALSFLLATAVFLIFRQLVTRHLDALSDYTSSLTFDSRQPPIVLDRIVSSRSSGDELDQVADAINSMHEQLADSLVELKQSERRQRSLLDNTSSVIYMKDVEGRYIFINRIFEQLFGVSNEEIRGKTDFDIFPKDAAEAFRANDLKAIQADEPIEMEEITPQEDGNHTYISVKFPLKNDSGEIYAVSGISTDITERIHLENQLRRSQRMEAVGQLTGGIAHDFNNLLGIMIGNVEILESRLGSDRKLLHHTNAVKNAVDRASSLTSRLLAFSRMQTLSPDTYVISKLIIGLVDMLQRTLGEDIELICDFGDDISSALVDADQFENALVNLAINARDAMPHGGILTIRADHTVLDSTFAGLDQDVVPGDYVVIEVSDTGFGMSSDIQEKVFEPFFTTKEFGKGSGLGLSMVYGFVKQSAGHITIQSEPEMGTTIRVFLPRSDGVVEAEQAACSLPDFRTGSETILVVEDDEHVRAIPVHILRQQGYRVVEANNGDAAVKLLENGKTFDLLFTDVILPGGMNGVEIAEKARRLQPDIKVLFTTGYAEHAVLQNQEKDLANSLISKPYRQVELLGFVQTILDK